MPVAPINAVQESDKHARLGRRPRRRTLNNERGLIISRGKLRNSLMDDIFQFQSELLYIWNITESFDSSVWSKKKENQSFSLSGQIENHRRSHFFLSVPNDICSSFFSFCLIFHYYKVSVKQMFVINKITRLIYGIRHGLLHRTSDTFQDYFHMPNIRRIVTGVRR